MAEKPTKPPKVFLSYAWEDDVKSWVRAFAARLRKDGVETVLDLWETDYGDQLPEFMEKSVRESDFVILICTPKYKKKSDGREGGVGYEGHIITAEIFEKSNHRKFIPVLRKAGWGFASPSWAAGKLYIDLSGNPYDEDNYRDLLRTLHGKKPTPPPVGKPPEFPNEDDDRPTKSRPKIPGKPLVSRDDVDKFVESLRSFARKLIPLIRIVSVLIIFGVLFWAGSWAVPKVISFIPTPKATSTRIPPPFGGGQAEIVDSKNVAMRLVPAGEFTMGSDSGESDEKPVHQVYLDAYYMDIYEVTNAAYKACVDAGECSLPKYTSSFTRDPYYGDSQFDDYPVIFVDWNKASAYCEWRGGRLPTEAEWEKAARGTDGRTYPWGEQHSCDNANYLQLGNDCVGDTTKVGSYESGISPYGLYDMAGNVWEWVKDWYDSSYYQISPFSNPLGPVFGEYRVLRGGSWTEGETSMFLRASSFSENASYFVGFRCAHYAKP